MLFLLLINQLAVPPRQQAAVVLRAPCLAEYLASDKAHARERMLSPEGDRYRAGVRQAKAPLVARMQQRGIPVTAQIETILNAILIDATDDDLAWLRAESGVLSVEYAVRMVPALDAATKLIGAPAIWTQLGGQDNTGKGIKIGMLDSGIDITNAMFNDAGFPASTLPANSYTNNKVIIAKNYVICAQDTANCNPTYDNSPVDGYGHGSHTASIAAGRCTLSPSAPRYANLCRGPAAPSWDCRYRARASRTIAQTNACLLLIREAGQVNAKCRLDLPFVVDIGALPTLHQLALGRDQQGLRRGRQILRLKHIFRNAKYQLNLRRR